MALPSDPVKIVVPAPVPERCDKALPNGSVCGRSVGWCIHKFVATRFGSASEPKNGVVNPNQ